MFYFAYLDVSITSMLFLHTKNEAGIHFNYIFIMSKIPTPAGGHKNN